MGTISHRRAWTDVCVRVCACLRAHERLVSALPPLTTGFALYGLVYAIVQLALCLRSLVTLNEWCLAET